MAQEVVEREREDDNGGVPLPPVTSPASLIMGDSSIDDQLEYLLNKTVRRNDPFAREYSASFNSVPLVKKINSDDSVAHLPLEQLIQKYNLLKGKILDEGKHWWTFADVVPTWEGNIERVFKGQATQTEGKKYATIIMQSASRCIMGESHGGSGWGNCSDCGWLGNPSGGLNAFIGSDEDGNYRINSRPGYDEYKIRYEYHWNRYHSDIGASESSRPDI